MPELLQRVTAMKVSQVRDRTRVDPNRGGASITSDMAMARYSRRFAEYWALHTTAELAEHTGEGVPLAQGTFRDVRFSLGITFSDEREF